MPTGELARELLEQGKIYSPPVDVVAIAGGCNVRVSEVARADWDSALDVGSRTLYITAGLTGTRKRFAVAHGLAHYLLHRDKARAFRERFSAPRPGLDPWELEANLFALDLLVPWDWAVAYRLYETLDQVAHRFGVTRALVETQIVAHGFPA